MRHAAENAVHRAVTIQSSIKGVADIIDVQLFAILLPGREGSGCQQLFIGMKTQEAALTMEGSGQHLPEAADEAASLLDKLGDTLSYHVSDVDELCEVAWIGELAAQNVDADEVCEDAVSVATTTRTGRVFGSIRAPAGYFQALDLIAGIGRKEHWIVDALDVCLESPARVLGVGNFGRVLAGKLNGSAVAVKVACEVAWDDQAAAMRRCKILELVNELQILRRIRHPGIVLFQGAVVEPQSLLGLALVFEQVNGERLKDNICVPPALPDVGSRTEILLQLASALGYLHSQTPRIVHGDLKHTNILVEAWQSGPRARLLDFGSSRLTTRHARSLRGTRHWMAPELLRDIRTAPSTSADVYSFGKLSFFVIHGLEPSGDEGGPAESLSFRGDSVALSAECRALCKRTLVPETASRPDMVQVLNTVSEWRSGPLVTNTMAPHRSPIPQTLETVLEKEATDLGVVLGRVGNPKNVPKQHKRRVRAAIPRLLLPGFEKTPSVSVGQALQNVIDKINPRGAGCCSWHIAVASASDSLMHMRSGACAPDFEPLRSWQCGRCGFMQDDEEDTDCDIGLPPCCWHCGGENDARRDGS